MYKVAFTRGHRLNLEANILDKLMGFFIAAAIVIIIGFIITVVSTGLMQLIGVILMFGTVMVAPAAQLFSER